MNDSRPCERLGKIQILSGIDTPQPTFVKHIAWKKTYAPRRTLSPCICVVCAGNWTLGLPHAKQAVHHRAASLVQLTTLSVFPWNPLAATDLFSVMEDLPTAEWDEHRSRIWWLVLFTKHTDSSSHPSRAWVQFILWWQTMCPVPSLHSSSANAGLLILWLLWAVLPGTLVYRCLCRHVSSVLMEWNHWVRWLLQDQLLGGIFKPCFKAASSRMFIAVCLSFFLRAILAGKACHAATLICGFFSSKDFKSLCIEPLILFPQIKPVLFFKTITTHVWFFYF